VALGKEPSDAPQPGTRPELAPPSAVISAARLAALQRLPRLEEPAVRYAMARPPR
jgi:hypothetical protein